MKVLNIVIAKVWGGGEQYVYDTSKALMARGVKVYIAVDKSNRELQERFGEVAEIIVADLYGTAVLSDYRQLQKFIQTEKIDIINCHSGHAMLLCTLLKMSTGARLVCFKHNAIKGKNDIYHRWQRKHTDAFVCVSKLVYELQTEQLSQREKDKYHIIYNGIDTDKFQNISKQIHDGFIIGYAGRITKDKGLDTLVEALSFLNGEYRLFIAGSDEKGYKAELEKLIKDKNLTDRVEFLGQIRDMAGFYSNIDLLVLPSKVREAFGLVICEAMYCGIPVITTNSGAQIEIISEDGCGKIVDVGDSVAIYEEIFNLQKNRLRYTMISRLARERIENHFTINICSKSLLNMYNGLILLN